MNIVVVDEDVIQMQPLMHELRLRGHTVALCRTADESLKNTALLKAADVVVVDLMLAADPDSTRFTRDNTADFLTTGIVLAQKIRRQFAVLPIQLVTNATDPRLLFSARIAMARLGRAALRCKHEFTTPMDFAAAIEHFVNSELQECELMATPSNDKYALLIAVEQYHDAAIKAVQYAENDAKEFANALEPHGYAKGMQAILLSSSATKTRIESVFRTTCESLRKGDQLFLFYAGHGFSDAGHNYLTCHDTVIADLSRTSIRLQWFLDTLRKSDCENALLFIDCCHSGLPIDESMRGLLSDMTDAEFREFCADSEYHLAFAACKADQKSFSSGSLKHGIWSYHLIEAFSGRSKSALDRDKFLTASSLQAHLSREVPRTLRHAFTGTRTQTPRCWGNLSRESILADFTEIFAARDARKKAGLGQLKRVSFWGSTWGSIKKLSGFKKHHRVPDSITSSTRAFVHSVGAGELDNEANDIFSALKSHFGYKRRDLTMSQDDGSVTILTPDFTVNVSFDIDDDDSTQYKISTEVTDIRNPASVAEAAFALVFDNKFDRIVLKTTGTVSVRDVIDKIESMDDDDHISVKYDADASDCTISVTEYGARIVLSAHELSLAFQGKVRVNNLLEAFRRLPTILPEGRFMALLPAPEEEREQGS